MKIFVAIPTLDYVEKTFVQDLLNLNWENIEHTISLGESSLVYIARERLIESALAGDYDYILWFDSDMNFKPDYVTQIIKSLNSTKEKDFMAALYFNRRPPFKVTICDKMRWHLQDAKVESHLFETIPNGITEIEACGFAGVITSTKMVREMKERFGAVFAPIGNGAVGEDYSFCIRARMCGYKLYCDTRIEMGHITRTVVTKATSECYNKRKLGNL